MGRAPCCDKAKVKRGPWCPEEDDKLKEFIDKQGTGGNWISLPQKAGLRRCGKSCRLRWLNYLRPNIKHGDFSDDEDRIICSLFASIGSRWSIIANQLPGRTDNDIKNYWNTKLKKKLLGMTPNQHLKRAHFSCPLPPTSNNNSHSLVQNYSMPSPYSFSQAYESGNSNYYSTMAFTTPNSSTTTTTAMLQSQDGCLGPAIQVSYNQAKHINNYNSNFLIFGGEAASCSSSDGSCTTNHAGQGTDQVEHDHDENLGLQSYFTNGGYAGDEKAAGAYGDYPLDYSIEEIKQLICTNSVCTNNLNFFEDDIKTEDKEFYY